MNTLIAYASKHGCAEKCAGIIKKELGDNADVVNLKEANDIDLSKYQSVIIGGSIYVGKIHKEVTEFCNNHLNELKQKKLGLFICGMQEEDVLQTELMQNFPAELLESAAAKDYFGGEFVFNKMNFLEKMVVKKVSKITSDKSNILFDRIQNFAESMK